VWSGHSCPLLLTLILILISLSDDRDPGAPFLTRSWREKACPELVEG